MKPIKIGVIGTGNMGRNHVRILREENTRFQLVGIYDADQPRREAIAQTYETTAFPSPQALLEKTDAVVVAVPSPTARRRPRELTVTTVSSLLSQVTP